MTNKSADRFRWSKEALPNPLFDCEEEKLTLMPHAKIFAKGADEPRNTTLLLLHTLYIAMFDLKGYYHQLQCSLKIEQSYREDHFTGENRRRNTRIFFGPNLEVEHQLYTKLYLPDHCHQRLLCYNAVDKNPFIFTFNFCGK